MSMDRNVDNELYASLNKGGFLDMTLVTTGGSTKNIEKETWKYVFDKDSKCCEIHRSNDLTYKRFFSDDHEIRFERKLDPEVTEVIMVFPHGSRIDGEIYHIINNDDCEILYYVHG